MPNGQNENLENLTIRDLFALETDKPRLAAGIEAKGFPDLEKQILSVAKSIPWGRVQEEVASIIPAMLDISLLESWARAWEKYQHLKDDVERSRNTPEAVVLSPLAEHSIDSTLHPYIEVFLGPKSVGKIKFDVTLTTQLKGLVLGLKNGEIVSFQLARCQWSGTIAAQGVPLLHRDLKTLDLPGRIMLTRAISLGANGNN